VGRLLDPKARDGAAPALVLHDRLEPAHRVLHETADLPSLVAATDRLRGPGLATNRTPSLLDWRYGSNISPAHFALRGPRLGGILVVRPRVRGHLRGIMLSEILLPTGGPALEEVVRGLGERVEADYVVAAATAGSGLFRALLRAGFLPVPRIAGPRLVYRPVGAERLPLDLSKLSSWRLSVGDIALL
jgi:hypothetical protein